MYKSVLRLEAIRVPESIRKNPMKAFYSGFLALLIASVPSASAATADWTLLLFMNGKMMALDRKRLRYCVVKGVLE